MSKFIGLVSAYAYAKSKGYTGTEEEFAILMAEYASVTETAVEAVRIATESAQSAAAASSDVNRAAATVTQQAAQVHDDAETSSESAATASEAKETAVDKALDSEAYALGTRGGEDVGSSDPAYHNNAKYYAESVSASAQTASEAAQTATIKASEAQASASAAAESAASLVVDAEPTEDSTHAVASGAVYDLMEDFVQISDDTNLKNDPDAYVRGSAILDSGAISTRSAYSMIRVPCLANVKYKITNPLGAFLRIGASSDDSVTQTLTHFTDSLSNATLAEFETNSGEVFLFVVYYNKNLTPTLTAETVLSQLNIVLETAKDDIARLIADEALRPRDIYIAAADSDERYKLGADYICTGANDELTIQAALDAVGLNGTLWVATGRYSIDSFPLQTDGQYCAIQIRGGNIAARSRVKIKCYEQTPSRVAYNKIENCAVFVVSQACYNSLDANTIYSVIGAQVDGQGARKFMYYIMDLEGIGIEIPGNQKKVIAFDAFHAFCMEMKRCMATCIVTTDANNASNLTVGDEDCVGIKCTDGSNFGQESLIESCAMYGFGQGIAVCGEHYILTNCKTIFNKYGFTFNWFGSPTSGLVHPNTLINCCSEMDFNYPYFAGNTVRQSVTLIDFNLEDRTAYSALGGSKAQEAVQGSWRGTIHYTIKTYAQDGNPSGNNIAFPFWESGHGANVETINDAQKRIVTEAERLSYAPNEMQRVYDTTANKFYTYVNGSWIAES